MGYSRSGVPFGLPVENKNYWGAPIESGVLVLDQDVNLMQRIQDEKLRTFLDSSFKDGWHYFDGFHSFGTNTFKINSGAFTLAGKISQWLGAFTSDNQITLPAAGGSPRTDLVWIEQWIEEVDSADVVYPYGNADYYGGGVANDIVDPAVGSACTNRVQIRYRTRVTPNASSLSNVACTAQGAQGTPGATIFSYDDIHNNWLASTGDTSYSLLDGKVYALPICTILRPASDDTVYAANVTDTRLHNSLSTATTNFVSSNILIGDAAGLALGSAAGCTFLGQHAGRDCTSNYNTFMGYHAGYEVTSGLANIFMGYNAGGQATGSYNVFIGNTAGFNSTSDRNVGVGYEAGRRITVTGGVFLGYRAGEATTIGAGSTFIGYESGKSNTISLRNTYVGQYSGTNVDGNDNTAIGYNALKGDAGGSSAAQNICLGGSTGPDVTTAHDNVLIGTNAGNSMLGGSSNILIGTNAGQAVTSNSYNTFVGCIAGYNLTGTYNTCLGHNTGQLANSTNGNTLVGQHAGFWATDGPNTFVGAAAGAYAQSAHGVYIGYGAGECEWDHVGTGDYNVFIGEQSGKLVEAGARNVCLGYRSGSILGGGDGNTLLGYIAGANVTGDTNIFIGDTAGSTQGAISNLFIMKSGSNNQFFQGNLATGHLGIGCDYSAYFGLRVSDHFGPDTDNAYDIGSATYRMQDVWASNGTIQTCDVTQKTVRPDKPVLGLDFINRLSPISFTWKNRTIPAKTEQVSYEKPKMLEVTKNIVSSITELREGKYVVIPGTRTVRSEIPEIEEIAVYDEEGKFLGAQKKHVMETVVYDRVITPEKTFEYKRVHQGFSAQNVKKVLDDLGIDTNDFAGYIHDKDSDLKALRLTEFIPSLVRAIQELSAKIIVLEK